jgi:signal transduction histidine kinase
MSVGLIISILIRIIAFLWSLILLHRIRDWRMGFLSIMLALMALRQILTLKAKITSTTLTFSSLGTEWPGLIVSLMAFLAVFYLGKILHERKQITAEQEKLIGELESQNAELERFTYTISHDLKTPLVSITGFLGYLRKDLESGNAKNIERDLARINGAANKMAQSLDDLLELSRIGRVVNPFQTVSLSALAHEALTQVETRLSGENVRTVVDPDMPEVFVDKSRLLEVLVILLDNAIKFVAQNTEACIEIGGGIDSSEIICFVKDNGVGIESQYHDYVFGLFDRLDPNIEGSGVGLTLARRIIESHRGRIWVDSEGIDRGCKFLFALPIHHGIDHE